MDQFLDRLQDPRMEYYRYLYRDSKMWDGTQDLSGKRIICYCEQGYGDQIQMARYFGCFKDCYLMLHCHKELHRIFKADEFIDKENCEELPQHDLHIASLSLPFVTDFDPPSPYLFADKADVEDGHKIGIVWEGNPEHPNDANRSCSLIEFACLAEHGKLFSLQKEIRDNVGSFELYGMELNDFYDTACLINAMDVVIGVDTAVMHLAGALGKECYCLLANEHDPRWLMKNWYPTMKFIKQKSPGEWGLCFKTFIYNQYK